MFDQTQTISTPAPKNPLSSVFDAIKQHRRLTVKLSVLLVILIGFGVYLGSYHRANTNVQSSLKTEYGLIVKTEKNYIHFDGPSNDHALIFYPNSRVEYIAYAPLMRKLAINGIDCFLIKMPLNLAILGQNRAESIIKENDFENWYIGGHSTGGAFAADYAAANPDQLKGLIMLATYSKNLLDESLTVVQIYGSEDKILNRKKLEKYASNLPESATIVEIPGANHTQFGNYGSQLGDGKATINIAGQQGRTAKIITDALLAH